MRMTKIRFLNSCCVVLCCAQSQFLDEKEETPKQTFLVTKFEFLELVDVSKEQICAPFVIVYVVFLPNIFQGVRSLSILRIFVSIPILSIWLKRVNECERGCVC